MYRQYAHAKERIQDAFIAGRACKQLTLRKGDISNGHGNSITGIDEMDKMYEGRNSKWNFGVYIPSGILTPDNPYKIAGIHSDNAKASELGKVFDLHIYGDQIRATINWYDDAGEIPPSHRWYMPVVFDTWMDFSVAYLMTKSSKGIIKPYVNGNRWFTYNGPTLFHHDSTSKPGRGPYTQLCVYDNDMEIDVRTMFVQTQPLLEQYPWK